MMPVRRVLLMVAMSVTLVALWPVLTSVYGELGGTVTRSPGWLGAMVGAVAVQMAANWELQRIVLRTSGWLDVAAPQLVGNAASHLMPGGNAVGAGLHARLLTVAGFDATSAAAGLGAVSVIGGVTGLVVLPAVVLGASAAGSTIDPSLIRAMWAGAAVLLILLGAIVVAFVRDRPWHLIASVIARFQRRRDDPGNPRRTRLRRSRPHRCPHDRRCRRHPSQPHRRHLPTRGHLAPLSGRRRRLRLVPTPPPARPRCGRGRTISVTAPAG